MRLKIESTEYFSKHWVIFFTGFSTLDVSATGGDDYIGISGLQLAFEVNERVQQVKVSIVNDSIGELTERFQAHLETNNFEQCTVCVAEITIDNDDDIGKFNKEG